MSEKWNNILVEWVNSLKLGKPLKSLCELRNGEFFLNLQQIITKNAKSDTDILTFIFELLAKHYPSYVVDNVSQIHLSDLPLDDLSSITSLLLHYICIYDRKDALISPMCYTLPEQTQLSIKCFLQKCSKTVTNTDLHAVIEQCTGYVQFNSPLQDLLRTPSRLHDKDRELSKLRTQLEVERDEKNDLLDEIKRYQEKTAKLNKSLQRKDLELLKLRNEHENPNKSEHDRSLNKNDSEKLLKCELESLEQYIGKCEEELTELKQKNEQLEKLSQKLQVESVNWQEKFLQTDVKLQQVEKQSNEQEVMINSLKKHCNELEELLNEYRNCKNESFEESFRYVQRRSMERIVVDEDLAHSVVEVQLRELQEACDDLKTELNEKSLVSEELQLKNDEQMKRIHKLEELNGGLETIKQELLKNIEEIKRENANLMIEVERRSQEIKEISALNKNLTSNISELKEILEETKNNLSLKETELKDIQIKYDMDVSELKSVLKCKEDSLDVLNCQFNKVQNQFNNLQATNNNLIEQNTANCKEIQQANEVNQNLNDKIVELQTEISNVEKMNQEQEEELKETRIKYDLKIKELEVSLNCKKNEVDDLNCRLTDLIDQCDNFKATINELKEENASQCKKIEEISLINGNLIEKMTEVQTELENMEEINREKDMELKENRSKYELEINQLKSNLKCKADELEVLNCHLISVRQENENLNATNDGLREENGSQNEQIKQITLFSENLNKEVSALQTKLENLQVINRTIKEEMKECRVQYDCNIKKLETDLNCKTDELGVLNCQLTNVMNQCENLIAINNDLKEENASQCKKIEEIILVNGNLSEKMDELNVLIENCEKLNREQEEKLQESSIKHDLEINELNNDLKCKTEELNVLNAQLTSALEQCEKLRTRINEIKEEDTNHCIEMIRLDLDNKNLLEKIDELQMVVENNEKVNREQEAELKEWKIKYEDDIKKFNGILQSKEQDLDLLNRQSIDVKIENDKLLAVYNELKEEIASRDQKIEQLTKINQDLSGKINELQISVESIEQICNTKEEELKENKITYESNLKEVENCLKCKEEEVEVLNSQLLSCNNECDRLKATISNLNDENVERSKELESITHLNQAQNEQLVSLKKSILEKEKEVNELKARHDGTLAEMATIIAFEQEQSAAKSLELEKLKNEMEEIQMKNTSLLNENVEYCNRVEEMNKLNEIQQADIFKLKETVSILEKDSEKQNIVIKESQAHLQDFKEKLSTKEEQITCLNSKLAEIESDLEIKNSTLETQAINLLNLTNTVNELNNQIDDLKTKEEQYKLDVEAMKSAQNSSDLTIKQIEETNQELQAIKTELLSKNEILDKQVVELELRIGKYCEDIKNLNEQIKHLNQVNEETMKIYSSEKETLIKNYESQINNMKLVNETQQQEIDQVKVINKDLTIAKQDAINKYEELQATVSTLVDETNKYSSQIEKMKETNDELKKTNDDLTKNYLTEKHSLMEEVNKLKTKHNIAIESLENEKHDLKVQHSNQIEEKQKMIEELSNSYEKELKEFTNQLLQLTTKNNELFSEHKRNLEEIDELRQELFNTKQENKKLEEEIEEKNVQYVELNDEFSEFKIESNQQIEDLTNNIHSMVEKYNMLKTEYENLEKNQNSNAESLRDELVACSEQISTDLSKIQSLTNDKEQLEQMVNYYKNELDRVKKDRNQIIESQTKIMKETENNILKIHEQEQNQRQVIEKDLEKIREAYGNVMSENSKLEMENLKLRKKLEEKVSEVSNYQHVKEAYEKLLEENNQYMIEVDTLQLKRSKDREEYVRLLKKEREEAGERENEIVKKIRLEYEEKLDKMKDKMLKLYREELDKELKKVENGKKESSQLRTTINDLRNELFHAEQKISTLERDLELTNRQSIRQSRESIQSLQDHKLRSDRNRFTLTRDDFKMHSARSLATAQETVTKQDRRFTSTLPRTGGPAINTYEETVTTTRRTSLLPLQTQNIEMEDEEESCLFNEKYVSDLKAGRCKVQQSINGESNASRYSELAWRNSLVPAHLKSSYPAETQFVSPTRFKEDDLKAGNIGLDDSLSKLLPGEKPRQRKDFGTTSYKRPGPPTPSKNGGRLSLQGNEVHPLREHNTEHARRTTPNRLKDLFKRSNVSRDNSENQSTTPRARRLSNIFRKPK